MQGREVDVDVDGIQRRLGCGRFQLLAFLSLGLIYSRGAWHVFGIMFLAGDPGHQCALPKVIQPELPSSFSLSSPSVPSELAETKSYDDQDSDLLSLSLNNGTGSYDSGSRSAMEVVAPADMSTVSSVLYSMEGSEAVSMDNALTNWTAQACTVSYVQLNGSQGQLTQDCPYGWTYGSLFDNTVLSEWDLVCDRDYLVELSITVFMVGATVGAVVLLPLADRFGRSRVMTCCLLAQAAFGTGAAFVHSYVAFTILRFIVGMLNIGIGICSYVLMTETFPAQRRTAASIAFQAFWALGVMTVAGFGFLLRNWRHLELMMTLPNLLALPCFWLMPESLPWLVSQKKWSQAIATITTIASINRKDPFSIISLIPTPTSTTTTTTAMYTCSWNSMNPNHSSSNQKTENSSSSTVNQNVEVRASCISSANQNAEDRTSDMSSPNQYAEDRISDMSPPNQDTKDRTSDMSLANHNAEDNKQKCSILESEIDALITDRDRCTNNVSYLGNGRHGADSVKTEASVEDIGQEEGCRGSNRHAANGKCRSRRDEKHASEQTPVSILDLFRHRRMCLYSSIMFFLFFVNSLGYFGISFSVPMLHGNQFLNLCIMGAVEIPANLICVIVGHSVGRRYPSAMFLLLCGVANIAALFLPSHIEWLKLMMVMMGKFAITAAYSTVYLYSAEIFPTIIRNQAMGMSSVFENIGSISAPFIVLAAKSVPEVALVVFGVLTVCGAGLTLLLPETHNRALPQTLTEVTMW